MFMVACNITPVVFSIIEIGDLKQLSQNNREGLINRN